MKKLYFIPLLSIFACIVMGIVVRNSYTNDSQKIYNFEYGSCGAWDSVYQQCGKFTSKDLIDKSDLIVKAKFNGERLITGNGFYSTVHISKIFKGDNDIKKDIIITEPVKIIVSTKFINPSYIPMCIPLQKDYEYIFLLKKIDFNEKRQLNDFQKNQYYPITSSPAGYYRLGGQVQTKLFNFSKDKFKLNELNGFDIYANKKEQLDIYYKYKGEVFKELGINA